MQNDNQLIPSKPLREKLGGISDMTLWRWLNNPEIDFPRPIMISKRRYWRELGIDEWIKRMSGQQDINGDYPERHNG